MRLLRHRGLVAALASFGLVLALGHGVAPASANGTPIRIVLSYLAGVSTFGPQNATGVAELVTGEGEVRLEATGLAQLPDGEHYEIWILNTSSSERQSLAQFRPIGDGTARVDTVLPQPIPDDRGWNLMVVSVEADGSRPGEPSQRRSLAGRFPPTEGGARPGQLPNTGGEDVAAAGGRSTGSFTAVAVLAVLLSGMLGFGLGRLPAKKSQS